MATTITNVAALSALLEFARANGFADTDVLSKMDHHLAILAKPKAKATEPSKTQRLNANLCEEVYAYLCEHGTVTAKGLADDLGSPYVTSSQKATILMAMLVTQGRAVRHSDKGKVWWELPKAE